MSRTTHTLSGRLVRCAARTAPRFISSRAVTFGLVVCLHAAVFYGLILAGMNSRLFKPAEPAALEPRVIDLPPITDVLPPDSKAGPEDVTVGPDPFKPLAAQPSLPPEVTHVQGGAGAGFPHPDEYYPDAAIRHEEQGAATLRVCVDPAGRLTSDPVTQESSGPSILVIPSRSDFS